MNFIKKDIDIFNKISLKRPYVWVATWFGSGFLRPAPGTWGSLASIPPGIIIYKSFGWVWFLIALAIITALGFWSADKFGKASGEHDHKMIVIDETVGQWLALIPVFYYFNTSFLGVLAAFILFRAFDITKPFPVSYFDKKMSGATGVMLDDVAAGIIAALILTGAFYAELKL